MTAALGDRTKDLGVKQLSFMITDLRTASMTMATLIMKEPKHTHAQRPSDRTRSMTIPPPKQKHQTTTMTQELETRKFRRCRSCLSSARDPVGTTVHYDS